jgi:hypothetical protein
MGYILVDAEDIIRASSARDTEIVASYDPEILDCLREDAGRHSRRNTSAHGSDGSPLGAKPRKFHNDRRIA